MQLRHQRAGQSLVEIALTIPLLVMLIFGMVDFGLAYMTNVSIRGAVSDGAYYASQHPGDDQGTRERIASALSDLNPAITAGNIAITSCVNGTSGPQTEINVTYAYHVIFGLSGSGPTITLHNGMVVPQFGSCN